MTSIVFPRPSDAMASGTVLRWLKRPGEPFSAGDALLELESEEALIVVEAATEGTLGEILAGPGQTVEVGARLALLENGDFSRSASAGPSSSEKSVPPQSSDSALGDVTPILMPQAGNSMEEGTVVSWLVKEGDRIEAGQTICEIETDKATIEYESPATGRVARIVAELDQPIPIQELIAVLAEDSSAADAYLASQGSASTSAKPDTTAAVGSPAQSVPCHRATTAVSARQRLRRSRPRGASKLRRRPARSPPIAASLWRRLAAAVVRADASCRPTFRPLPHRQPPPAAPQPGAAHRCPKCAARSRLNLQQSKQTVPHFYVRMSIDADPLLAFYREQKPATNCTLNDIVVLAVGRTIAEFPAVRSQVDGNDLVEFPHANIGIAVGVEDGLVVPVVLKVDTLSLAQVAGETRRVVENGRNGKLENVGQGVFTITNLGMFGIEEFAAIINPPESGILAVSAIRETAIVENGALRPGRTMTMTLSADHRVVDGLLAAKFVARLKQMLEHPAEELA